MRGLTNDCTGAGARALILAWLGSAPARSIEAFGCSGNRRRALDCTILETMCTPMRFAIPEWLITAGSAFFILALAVSAIFVPELRWLHIVQATMYLVLKPARLFSCRERKSAGMRVHSGYDWDY